MDILQIMQQRKSIRHYLDKEIEMEICQQLQTLIECCNREFDLHLQLVTNEPKAFQSALIHYGFFSNVKNYITLIGKKCDNLDEKLGYAGEKVVLFAQSLGLNSCWVGLTFKKVKTAFQIHTDEKMRGVITLGYASKGGRMHKSKSIEQVSIAENPPQWFINGVQAALLAPTALNQQKFVFKLLENNVVEAKAKLAPWSKMDLGIAKYHFELGAGTENFTWLY